MIRRVDRGRRTDLLGPQVAGDVKVGCSPWHVDNCGEGAMAVKFVDEIQRPLLGVVAQSLAQFRCHLGPEAPA